MDELDENFRYEHGLLEIGGAEVWSAATVMLVFVIGFRTNRAYTRFWEAAGLLHQMRGEWFDTVSNCVTFSITTKPEKKHDVREFRHALVRLMSLCHGIALEEVSDNQFDLSTIDVLGLDLRTLEHLTNCSTRYHFNKVEVNIHLIQTLITTAFNRNILDVPAPILSRVFQTISRGFVNYLNAKKIAAVKFPFPYSQLTAFLLLASTFLTPLMLQQS
eukprot:CAMPEP_0179287606 /NCGR_PEP_ID=MMETSP0797-20121207/40353_1 /TAXON_ID=47934 /ORGANISM="Dinophysis acuminata, Strain DAEP01" /LENGTH=216 /DNA_ID=CAMNT_0020996545 /DNA_START=148 /DNA_END=799 /DNA_ORIENTATION=-